MSKEDGVIYQKMGDIMNDDIMNNKMVESIKKQELIVAKQLEPIQAIVERQEVFENLLRTQQTIDNMTYNFKNNLLEAISPISNVVANITQNQIDIISNSIARYASYQTEEILRTINSPIMKWANSIIQPALITLAEELHNSVAKIADFTKYNDKYLAVMYDAKWFPYLGWNASISLSVVVMDIVHSTRQSKNRIRQIDKVVFEYYSKNEIENIRKSWKMLDISPTRLKIINQAVKAYHRKEYVLTVSALVSLWEGMIAEKVHVEDNYRVGSKTKENLTRLINDNEYKDIFASFCNDFIFYTCTAQEEFKEDVPGRHGIAHSWYTKYPSKKMALNAILFTDFLLNLKPLENQK